MKANNKKRDLANILRKDLSEESIVNYIKENIRTVKNEIKYGRSPRKYQFCLDAGILALLEGSLKNK